MISREKHPEDVEQLVAEVEWAVRDAVGEGELAENIEDLVTKVNEAVRNAVNGEKADDVDAVMNEVRLAVRAVVGEEKHGVDMDSLLDKVGRAVRVTFSQWKEAAESVGYSLKDRIRVMLEGVRGTGRNSVVMVRVNRESQERMDELIEAGLVGSRSEGAAYLIAVGIEARQELFDGIASKIAAIRKAKEELQRLLNEEGNVRI